MIGFIQEYSQIIQVISTLLLVFVTWRYVRLTEFLVSGQGSPLIFTVLTIDTTGETNYLLGNIKNYGNKPALTPFLELVFPDKSKRYEKLKIIIEEKSDMDIKIPIICYDDNIPSILNIYYSNGRNIIKIELDFERKTSTRKEYRFFKKNWFYKTYNLVYFVNQKQIDKGKDKGVGM